MSSQPHSGSLSLAHGVSASIKALPPKRSVGVRKRDMPSGGGTAVLGHNCYGFTRVMRAPGDDAIVVRLVCLHVYYIFGEGVAVKRVLKTKKCV